MIVKIVSLIRDPSSYSSLIDRMNALSLPSSLYRGSDDEVHVASAVAYLLSNHQTLHNSNIGIIRMNATATTIHTTSNSDSVTIDDGSVSSPSFNDEL
jgi:hypothetical protein